MHHAGCYKKWDESWPCSCTLYMSTSHPSMAALASVLDLFLKDRRRKTMKGIAAYARHTNVLTADFSV